MTVRHAELSEGPRSTSQTAAARQEGKRPAAATDLAAMTDEEFREQAFETIAAPHRTTSPFWR